jgi:hypothetical protein
VKARFPDKTEATILSEADIPYEVLVNTMDAVRTFTTPVSGKLVYAELFPDLSIGDAPATLKDKP